jgi:hypothetical protein
MKNMYPTADYILAEFSVSDKYGMKVYIYNMRYRGSVEDRVHELLSGRLEDIYAHFGRIGGCLDRMVKLKKQRN